MWTAQHIKKSLVRFWWRRVVLHLSPRGYYQHWVDADPEGEDPTAHEDYAYFETIYWNKRAEKVHVSSSDIPLEDGQQSHWHDAYDGSRYIGWNSLRKLKKLVIDAEYEVSRRKREGRELGLKYFTVISAFSAALASITNMLIPEAERLAIWHQIRDKIFGI